MTTDSLAARGKSLEDAFFAKQDAALRRRLADLDDSSRRRDALAQASGIADREVLGRLEALGLSGPLLAAISLVPLVAVAWADGTISEEERTVLLAGAERAGLDKAHAGHALFESWLERRPPSDLLDKWLAYVAALDPDARTALRDDVLGRARTVAEAAGGFLGLTARTSSAEREVLGRIERALAA